MTATPNELDLSLGAAIKAPEDDLSLPSRTRASSLTQQLSAADVGDVVFRGIKVVEMPDDPAASALSNLSEQKERLRNNCAKPISDTRKKHGYEFSVEVDHLLTGKGNLYIVAAITRTA